MEQHVLELSLPDSLSVSHDVYLFLCDLLIVIIEFVHNKPDTLFVGSVTIGHAEVEVKQSRNVVRKLVTYVKNSSAVVQVGIGMVV